MPRLVSKGLSGDDFITQLDQARDGSLVKIDEASDIAPPSRRSPLRGPLWLMKFPNTAFGISLGLGGHSALWKVLSLVQFSTGVGTTLNYIFWFGGILIWAMVGATYIVKGLWFPVIVQTEWRHPVRSHFFNIIHCAVLTLAIGTPTELWNSAILRGVWVGCAIIQASLTQHIYARWIFDDASNIGHARPPFLLSTVGWLLLSILGQQTNVHGAFGLNLAAFCFGAGAILYFLVLVSIFLSMHDAATEKGSPALFLFLAPASLGTVALVGFDKPGTFGNGACAGLGWCVVVFILLLRLSGQLFTKPVLLGTYWAYVFPLAAFATASVKYAAAEQTAAARVLAWGVVGLASITLILVFMRMSIHHVGVVRGKEAWGDPLVDKLLEIERREATEHFQQASAVRFLGGQLSLPAAPNEVLNEVRMELED